MIVQIIRESTIDYPGKFGPLVLTKGCNFKCGFCHNAALNSAEDSVNEDEFLKNIEHHIRLGWYNGITISGGEPTLHPELEGFLGKLKKLGLSVKLDSNGTNPEKLKKFLDLGLVNYVAMDIKGPKELYSEITNSDVDISKIEESIKILSNLQSDKFEFRTTIPFIFEKEKPRAMNKKEAEEMAKWIFELTNGKDKTEELTAPPSSASLPHPPAQDKLINQNNLIGEQSEQNNLNQINKSEIRWFLQAFVSRDKDNINDSRLSVESLPKEMQKTSDNVMQELKEAVGKYFKNVKVR
jgi:pyruvate formate lyase activating enzyme